MNNSGTIKNIAMTNPGMSLELEDGRTIRRIWDEPVDMFLLEVGMKIEWSTSGGWDLNGWFNEVRILE